MSIRVRGGTLQGDEAEERAKSARRPKELVRMQKKRTEGVEENRGSRENGTEKLRRRARSTSEKRSIETSEIQKERRGYRHNDMIG